jgi:hypothetical protein
VLSLVRVTFIGNGFILREYYPDAIVDNSSVAIRLWAEESKGQSDRNEALDSIKGRAYVSRRDTEKSLALILEEFKSLPKSWTSKPPELGSLSAA